METHKTLDWPSCLRSVVLAINASIARSIKTSPLGILFAQHPCTDEEVWKIFLTYQQENDSNVAILEELSADIGLLIKKTDPFDLDSNVIITMAIMNIQIQLKE